MVEVDTSVLPRFESPEQSNDFEGVSCTKIANPRQAIRFAHIVAQTSVNAERAAGVESGDSFLNNSELLSVLWKVLNLLDVVEYERRKIENTLEGNRDSEIGALKT